MVTLNKKIYNISQYNLPTIVTYFLLIIQKNLINIQKNLKKSQFFIDFMQIKKEFQYL